jgi:hypothetical protein
MNFKERTLGAGANGSRRAKWKGHGGLYITEVHYILYENRIMKPIKILRQKGENRDTK